MTPLPTYRAEGSERLISGHVSDVRSARPSFIIDQLVLGFIIPDATADYRRHDPGRTSGRRHSVS